MEVQDQIASSISRQMRKAKRKLQLVKCDRCRHDKQKCNPTTRVWPDKCDRCVQKGFPCSNGTRLERPTKYKPKQLTPPDDEHDGRNVEHGDMDRVDTWIFLIDFLKILRLAKQRFRDLEKEMLTPFCDSYDPEPIPDEDALDLLIGKFKNTIIDLKSDIMGTANPSDISRVTDCLLFAALDATESGVAMEKSNCAFCSPEKNDVVNDLRKRKLMCSEVLFRCRQLDACFNSGHRLAHSVDELIDASEALEVMCKELFSVCMSITRHVFATWSEWWTTTLQRIATFLIRHVADIASRWRESNSRGAAFLATGNLRAYDCLGRNLAHHMFDASDGGKNGDWQVVLLAHMQSCTAELDEQDGFGRTVLHIACQKNYFITIEWLLQHGANPSLLTVDGHSPLHYAAAQGFIRICEMLLDRKDSFDIDQGDSFYLTARDYASDNRSHEIVDLIDKARVLNDMKRTTSSPEDHGSQEGTPEAWASRLGV